MLAAIILAAVIDICFILDTFVRGRQIQQAAYP